MPKIREFIDVETIQIIQNKEDFAKTLFDPSIIKFLDSKIEMGVRYLKRFDDSKNKGLLSMLKVYNSLLFAKYSISHSQDFRKDIFKWADYNDLNINQYNFNKKKSRRDISSGKEYYTFTPKQ